MTNSPGIASPSSTSLDLQEGWLISGLVEADDESGTLDYAMPMLAKAVEEQPGSGAYRVELRGASGAVRFSYAFEPTPLQVQAGTSESGIFNFVVPRIPGVTSVQLWNEDTLLDELAAAAAPPDLRAWDTRSGDTILVSWEASSPDGVPVLVALRYSRDGGDSWQGLAIDLTTSFLELDASRLPGSDDGLVEVIAHNTTQAETVRLNVGAIDDKPPRVAIFGDALIQLETGDPLVLTGSAVDLEDGVIPDADLSWSHSQMVTVGSGQTLILSEGLPEGEYSITLSATDSAGAETEASVEVIVTAPPATPGRMTGVGRLVATDGTRVFHAFRMHCDASIGPNRLKMSWHQGKAWKKRKWFVLENLVAASCVNDPAAPPTPAGFNIHEGLGRGRLDGKPGATINWTLRDMGQPGKKKDSADITITDASGRVVLSVSEKLKNGNHKAHKY